MCAKLGCSKNAQKSSWQNFEVVWIASNKFYSQIRKRAFQFGERSQEKADALHFQAKDLNHLRWYDKVTSLTTLSKRQPSLPDLLLSKSLDQTVYIIPATTSRHPLQFPLHACDQRANEGISTRVGKYPEISLRERLKISNLIINPQRF